jgi:hypothetical protein
MAVSMTAKHHIWTLRMVKELLRNDEISADSDIPAAIRNDNTGALDIAGNRRINDRSKHIDIHYDAVRELVESGQITILHIDGKENLADVCAKALPQAPRERLCAGIADIFGGNSSGK